jgi:hypothetical protein
MLSLSVGGAGKSCSTPHGPAEEVSRPSVSSRSRPPLTDDRRLGVPASDVVAREMRPSVIGCPLDSANLERLDGRQLEHRNDVFRVSASSGQRRRRLRDHQSCRPTRIAASEASAVNAVLSYAWLGFVLCLATSQDEAHGERAVPAS